MTEKSSNSVSPITVVVVVGFAALVVGGIILQGGISPSPSSPAVQRTMDDIHRQVLSDSIDEYNIVPADDLMRKCVHAGMVVAAAIQATDATAIDKWRAI